MLVDKRCCHGTHHTPGQSKSVSNCLPFPVDENGTNYCRYNQKPQPGHIPDHIPDNSNRSHNKISRAKYRTTSLSTSYYVPDLSTRSLNQILHSRSHNRISPTDLTTLAARISGCCVLGSVCSLSVSAATVSGGGGRLERRSTAPGCLSASRALGPDSSTSNLHHDTWGRVGWGGWVCRRQGGRWGGAVVLPCSCVGISCSCWSQERKIVECAEGPASSLANEHVLVSKQAVVLIVSETDRLAHHGRPLLALWRLQQHPARAHHPPLEHQRLQQALPRVEDSPRTTRRHGHNRTSLRSGAANKTLKGRSCDSPLLGKLSKPLANAARDRAPIKDAASRCHAMLPSDNAAWLMQHVQRVWRPLPEVLSLDARG